MNVSRRLFLYSSIAAIAAPARTRPNVVLIITDDQGYGDVGIHGNKQIRTPNMDRIAREGVQFTQFQVCPVCSPTRSSLMTGRYNYRTGVVDTYLGRSMMYQSEVTLPELLGRAGYKTGIFGKWHLGDTYPLRAMDQGFQKSVVIRGGGLGQPSDVPGGGSYTDPILMNDGKPERFKGYCTDVFTNEALHFLDSIKGESFFLYLASNAPHDPLGLPNEEAVAGRRASGLDDRTARTYLMVENIDANIGRVLDKLKSLGLEENTIVIFMTDNGPQRARYNADMRGTKGTVYQGGIRVPFFVRWPAVVKPDSRVDRIAAHIDLFPTLLDACGVAKPKHVIDGRSLMPLLRDPGASWPDRFLFTQWHRGDRPEAFRASAVRNQQWKLVNGKELYDLAADPREQSDVAASHPEVVSMMRSEYEKWFRDVSGSHGYQPPRIVIGDRRGNPVVLTRQDWRGPRAGWDADSIGSWEVEVVQSGTYEVSARIAPVAKAAVLKWSLGGSTLSTNVPEGGTTALLGRTHLARGAGTVESQLVIGTQETGVESIEIRRLGKI